MDIKDMMKLKKTFDEVSDKLPDDVKEKAKALATKENIEKAKELATKENIEKVIDAAQEFLDKGKK